MDIKITLNTGNAAFGESPETETARILRDLAEKIEMHGISGRSLRDLNGNTVGSLEVTD